MKVSGVEWGVLEVPNGLTLDPRKRLGPNLFRAEIETYKNHVIVIDTKSNSTKKIKKNYIFNNKYFLIKNQF